MPSIHTLRPIADWGDGAAYESPHIQGVYMVLVRKLVDERGYFFESFRRSWLPGIAEMVQGMFRSRRRACSAGARPPSAG
jgi:dTDP-4-dehydrorhamnose 3,5-epimerase-like enzyme